MAASRDQKSTSINSLKKAIINFIEQVPAAYKNAHSFFGGTSRKQDLLNSWFLDVIFKIKNENDQDKLFPSLLKYTTDFHMRAFYRSLSQDEQKSENPKGLYSAMIEKLNKDGSKDHLLRILSGSLEKLLQNIDAKKNVDSMTLGSWDTVGMQHVHVVHHMAQYTKLQNALNDIVENLLITVTPNTVDAPIAPTDSKKMPPNLFVALAPVNRKLDFDEDDKTLLPNTSKMCSGLAEMSIPSLKVQFGVIKTSFVKYSQNKLILLFGKKMRDVSLAKNKVIADINACSNADAKQDNGALRAMRIIVEYMAITSNNNFDDFAEILKISYNALLPHSSVKVDEKAMAYEPIDLAFQLIKIKTQLYIQKRNMNPDNGGGCVGMRYTKQTKTDAAARFLDLICKKPGALLLTAGEREELSQGKFGGIVEEWEKLSGQKLEQFLAPVGHALSK